MSFYRYVASDPRQSRSHYFYAPFEGLDLLRYWSKARADFMSAIDIGDVTPPALESFPHLGSQAIDCEADLRSCAVIIARKTASDSRLEKWVGFVQRKIDITHRLRAQYDAQGKILNPEDAGPPAYAFAAYLLAWQMNRCGNAVERLKWLNALLKCNDILTVSVISGLDSFAAFCAKQALLTERDQILDEAVRLQISW